MKVALAKKSIKRGGGVVKLYLVWFEWPVTMMSSDYENAIRKRDVRWLDEG